MSIMFILVQYQLWFRYRYISTVREYLDKYVSNLNVYLYLLSNPIYSIILVWYHFIYGYILYTKRVLFDGPKQAFLICVEIKLAELRNF